MNKYNIVTLLVCIIIFVIIFCLGADLTSITVFRKPALDGLYTKQWLQEDIEENLQDCGSMDLKSTHASPVLTDPTLMSNSRVGVPSTLLPYTPQSSPFSNGKYVSVPRKKTGKLDDVLASGWLDAMLSSSPPRKKLIKDLNIETGLEDLDIAYSSWTLDHPSALKSFIQIINLVKDKKIAMFLDYDGTLSPIVDDPNRAIMPEGMHTVVEAIAKHFPTAIISGRNRDKVYELVGLTDLYYAGSHGMDILGPASQTALSDHPDCTIATDDKGEEVNLFQPAREFIHVIDEVFRTLVENTKGIEGAKVENHKFCASVHYRNVDEKNWTDVAQCVHDVLNNYPRLRLTHGRKVLEVRPAIDWNKGKAVEFLLESLGREFFPIYIGDDRTDEDAFKVLQERNLGFGILVSSIPKETKAFYSLNDPSEVQEFLQSLVRWKEEEYEAKSND